MGAVRNARTAVEVVTKSPGKVRSARTAVEVLTQQQGKVRSARTAVEVLTQQQGKVRSARSAVEVLMPYPEPTQFRWGIDLAPVVPWPAGLVTYLEAGYSEAWQTAGGAAAVANNDPVGVWRDRIAGLDAVQATAGARPLLIKGAYNGHDVLRFDGSDDQLVLPGSAAEQVPNVTVFIVAKATAAGGRSLIAKSHTTSGWSSPYARWILYTDGSYNTRWNGVNVAQGSWSTGDLKVLEYVDADVYANGVKVVDATDADLTYPGGTTPILISGNGVGSERFAGDVGFIGIWNRSLDVDERAVARAKLGALFGVTVV